MIVTFLVALVGNLATGGAQAIIGFLGSNSLLGKGTHFLEFTNGPVTLVLDQIAIVIRKRFDVRHLWEVCGLGNIGRLGIGLRG